MPKDFPDFKNIDDYIFVTGPENSGSKLAAQICAHMLKVKNFGEWDGTKWVSNADIVVIHRSIPYGDKLAHWPDFTEWQNYVKEHNAYAQYILCTRDPTLSALAATEKRNNNLSNVWSEQTRAENEMVRLLEQYNNIPTEMFIFSYESLLTLGLTYLNRLAWYLGVPATRVPRITIKDSNFLRIEQIYYKTKEN